MCGGGGDVNYPAADPKQVELEQMQLDALNKQQGLMDSFLPILTDQYGLKQTNTLTADESAQLKASKDFFTGEVNKWKAGVPGFSDADTKDNLRYAQEQLAGVNDRLTPKYEMTPEAAAAAAARKENETLALGVQKQQLQYQSDALNGKLPLSAALTQQKAIDFQKLKNQLADQGDLIMGDDPASAVAKSTSGQQALESFNKTYGALESNERMGIITSGADLAGTYGRVAGDSASYNRIGVPNLGYGDLASGYGGAMAPYMQQQQGQYQAGAMSAQLANQRLTGMMQMAGSLGGAAMTAAPMLMMCSRTFKKNIEQLTEQEENDLFDRLMATPLNRYHYKGESDAGLKHLSVMSEEAPQEIVTEDGKHLSVTDYYGMLTLAIKVLNRRFAAQFKGAH